MALFRWTSRRIHTDIRLKIYLKDKITGKLSNEYAEGIILNISKEGGCVSTGKMILDGMHLFFSTQEKKESLLYLSDLELDAFDTQDGITATSIWMDGFSDGSEKGFKLGVIFTQRQVELFAVVKKLR